MQIIPYADLVVLKLLGSGRYGIVYHGKWMGTDVAIKIFDKSRVAKDYLDRLVGSFLSVQEDEEILHCLNTIFRLDGQ